MSRRSDRDIEFVARAASKGAAVLRREYQADPAVYDLDLRAAEAFLLTASRHAVEELRRRAQEGQRAKARRQGGA